MCSCLHDPKFSHFDTISPCDKRRRMTTAYRDSIASRDKSEAFVFDIQACVLVKHFGLSVRRRHGWIRVRVMARF